MSFEVKSPKKLIEVALPLDIINEAAAREKSIRHGHPSTLHLWWARRPLAAARAVIFGQLVNNPSWKWEMENPGQVPPNHLKASWAASRKRLFKIIEDIVKWENTTNEEVMEKAREEIRKSWREVCELNKEHPQAAELFNPDKLPALHDPFAGGGAIPLEAQRLGLEAYASDLNPVAVLINKAMIEIPPKFAGRAPIGPIPEDEQENKLDLNQTWPGATGLAEDVRRYGIWMREEAKKRIGHLYPSVEITKEMAVDRPDLEPLIGQKLTVIAWIWARTVKSPNPAFSHVDVPLASTFVLSSKKGKEAYVQPVIDGDSYQFKVIIGTPPLDAENGTKIGKKGGFRCIISNTPIGFDYIRREGVQNKINSRLLAIVVEGRNGRIYLSPQSEKNNCLEMPIWKPVFQTYGKCRVNIGLYGFDTWDKLFTTRQLVALNTFCELVSEVRKHIVKQYDKSEIDFDQEYTFALSIYLSFGVSRAADAWSSQVTWRNQVEASRNTFARQALPMTWDFTEINPFSNSCGNWIGNSIDWVQKSLQNLPVNHANGKSIQCPAQHQNISLNKLISTDPPYYDNIEYADLSDFFYVWLRHILNPVIPDLFSTISVPKNEELVAAPHRHGSKDNAEKYFLSGMTKVITNLSCNAHPSAPVTIFYAFKQSETDLNVNTSSTGWETFLEAVFCSNFAITGTWPMRTEKEGRVIGNGSNALASSIVLVCRKRSPNAPTISRRDFIRELNKVLPEALDEMTKGSGDDRSPVAPVDLSQAIIGPGMAVFSKYSAVLEADGTPMTVKTALQLINRFLAEDDFDPDTQFCLHWFDQYGWGDGVYGQADVLARAKATSVDGLVDAGVVKSGSGVVRLKKWVEYPSDWDPTKDNRLPVWETLHHLIRALKQDGESAAGVLLGKVREKSESARQLAYRLYTLCERQGWAEDARAYNELITSWTGIESAITTEVDMQSQTTLEI